MTRSVRQVYKLGDPELSGASAILGDQLRAMLDEDISEPDSLADAVSPPPGNDSFLSGDDSVPQANATAPTANDELEAAAWLLLEKVPGHVQAFIREHARIHSRYPVWVFVMGAVLRQYSVGQLQAPMVERSWIRDHRTGALGPQIAVCEYCEKAFQEKNFGQRFCSNECGYAAEARAKAA